MPIAFVLYLFNFDPDNICLFTPYLYLFIELIEHCQFKKPGIFSQDNLTVENSF